MTPVPKADAGAVTLTYTLTHTDRKTDREEKKMSGKGVQGLDIVLNKTELQQSACCGLQKPRFLSPAQADLLQVFLPSRSPCLQWGKAADAAGTLRDTTPLRML